MAQYLHPDLKKIQKKKKTKDINKNNKTTTTTTTKTTTTTTTTTKEACFGFGFQPKWENAILDFKLAFEKAG